MKRQLPYILGVFNQKGGVGKSLVSAIVAEYAAIKAKMNVLVVDLDMQCNSSDYWVGIGKRSTRYRGAASTHSP